MTKKAYIVSFRRDPDDPCCTNVAMAECERDVAVEYAECDWLSIDEAPGHKVDALKTRGCPVIECPHMPTFEEFDEQVGDRKTGGYGRGVDMYTKRTGERVRVFRVHWFERSAKYATHEAYLEALGKAKALSERGVFGRPLGSEWVEKNKVFPYTADGLEEAIRFSAKEAAPKMRAFQNREC